MTRTALIVGAGIGGPPLPTSRRELLRDVSRLRACWLAWDLLGNVEARATWTKPALCCPPAPASAAGAVPKQDFRETCDLRCHSKLSY